MVRFQRKSVLSIFVLFLLMFCAGSTWAAEHGTIVTKSGDSYADVDYTVNRSYRVIEIKQDSGKKKVSFDQVKVILDADGKDVTEMVLRDYYKPTKEETLKSKNSSVRSESKEKSRKFGIRISPTFNVTAGDYLLSMDPGIGIEGSFLIPVSGNIDLRLTFGKSGLSTTKRLKPLEMNVRKYYIELLYHKRIREIAPWNIYSYAANGYGMTSNSLTSTDLSRTVSDFTMTLGGGFWVMLTKTVAIDLFGSIEIGMQNVYPGGIEPDEEEITVGEFFNFDIGIFYML